MADKPAQWTFHVYGILEHPEQGQVWLLQDEQGYRLPWFSHVQEQRWLPTVDLVAGLEKVIGVPIHLLRAQAREDEENRLVELTAILEVRQGLPTSPGRWVGPDQAGELALPAGKAQLTGFFIESSPENTPPERAPWAYPGWRPRAEAWIRSSLQAAGKGSVRKIELLRTWSISCLMTAETEDGERFYFKAVKVEPLFVNEGPITQALAKFFPDIIQPPIAVNEIEHWMLSPSFSGEIGWGRQLDEKVQLVKTWAQVQKRSIPLVGGLLAAGCIDRRLDWLAEQVQGLFADEEATRQLSRDEIAELQAFAPDVIARCRELAVGEVPPALVHGDLHGGNIAMRPDGLTIFDWTDACITHPFLDMLLVYDEDDPAQAETLQQAYLSEWETFARPDRLRQLWELAQPVFGLHHALSYHTIVKNVEPAAKRDLDWGTPFFLRKILASFQ